MSGPPVRAVTFDLGDTLIRTGHGSVTSQLAVCLGVELPVLRGHLNGTAKRVRETPDALARELCAAFTRPEARGPITAILDREAEDSARVPDVYDDVTPVLARLTSAGLVVCGLSNLLGAVAPDPSATARQLGLDAVFYSCDLGSVKPEVKAYRHVERALGFRRDALLHVGDSEEADVRGACRSGWRALLLRRGEPAPEPVLPEPGTAGRIESLAALVSILLHPRPAAQNGGTAV